jgi:hypothetical protein
MSRSGYSDDCGGWGLIMWRGAVNSAIKGKRGQAFLREMLEALDALPEKKLISSELKNDVGEVCALGSVGVRRGLDMEPIDLDDREGVAKAFGIAEAMAAEIMFINDDEFAYWNVTPEKRYARVRAWVVEHLKEAPVT